MAITLNGSTGITTNGITDTTGTDALNNVTVAGTLAVTGAVSQTSSSTAASFIPTGSTVPANGMYRSAANTLDFATNTTNQVSISSTGIVTGTAGNLMLVQGTSQASTSGTSITFTGIPSWVKRITITFAGVSNTVGGTAANGTQLVQLGTGATPTWVTSGYIGSCDNRANTTIQTTGFGVQYSGASNYVISGQMVLCLNSGNTWTETVNTSTTTAGLYMSFGAGYVALGAALTAVRVTTVGGTDTFTAGSINILYE